MTDVLFEFIIDTDSYAGNFEREICAYITGMWDHETHGRDQAAIFKKEVGIPNPFEEYITYVYLEHGYAPQQIIWEPIAKAMNSVSIFFEKEPTPELIAIMKERAYRFSRYGLIFNEPVRLKILRFRFLKRIIKIETVEI